MHDDLLRRALESKKTTSKKAKSSHSSRAVSGTNSQKTSKPVSRIQSRDASDDEDNDGNLSDETNQSINSIDELLASDDFNEASPDVLKQRLRDTIADFLDRKNSNNKSREDGLAAYVAILTSHYIADVLFGKVEDLVSGFVRSVRTETSEKETILALKALALTAITFSNNTIYENAGTVIKNCISDSQSMATKVAAIHTLGNCLTFGGAGEDETAETMTFLLEIASSDGSFVEATDNANVVAASMQVYAYLATEIEDLEAESEDAIATFLDQLDSSEAEVQIAAGEAIALLYEKSYTPIEDDESSPEASAEDDSNGDGDGSLIKRYNAYHNTDEVLEKAQALASLSTKAMHKNSRRKLHQTFTSIMITVENPKLGLQTHNSSRMTVRVHKTGEMKVDTWWKLMRLNALRRLLAGGFVNHYYEGNKQVLAQIPLILRETGGPGLGTPRKGAKLNKGQHGRERRFVSGNHVE